MNQLSLPFDKKEPAAPRVVTVKYENSDFNAAIAAAKEKYGQGVGVIAVPAGLKLGPIKRRKNLK